MGLPWNENGVLGHDFGSEFAQRRDVVNDPDAAAVRGDDQRRFAGLNGDVAHRDVGKFVALVLRPLLAAVERNPQPEFRAEEQAGWAIRCLP